MSEADGIASAVLDEFEKLAPKRKPAVRDNGLHEWVPLSGIVAKGRRALSVPTSVLYLGVYLRQGRMGRLLTLWRCPVY